MKGIECPFGGDVVAGFNLVYPGVKKEGLARNYKSILILELC